MKEVEKIIWQYLDDALTNEEKVSIESKLLADPDFKESFETAERLHNTLKEVKSDKAPDFILSNIMLSIKDAKIYSAPTTHFGGLKYIGFILSAITIVALVTISIFGGAKSAASPKWDFLGKLSNGLEHMPMLGLPEGLDYAIPYASLLGCLLILFWVDLYLNKIKVVRTK